MTCAAPRRTDGRGTRNSPTLDLRGGGGSSPEVAPTVPTVPAPIDHASVHFESELLMDLSGLVNRWASHDFRQLHAGRLATAREYYSYEVLYALAWHGPSRPSFIAEHVGPAGQTSAGSSTTSASPASWPAPPTPPTRAPHSFD